jgi:hypothetical protein
MKISVRDKDGAFHQWYLNSMRAVSKLPGKLQHYNYADTYKVKLHFFPTFRALEAIEFPNEEEAVLFILRWSYGEGV